MYTHANIWVEIQEKYEPFHGPPFNGSPVDKPKIMDFSFYVHFLRGRVSRFNQIFRELIMQTALR